ncbi:phosphatidylglycerophosphate synthase [Roseiarcus fermentans]|uniref:Phosphatidylglycerophosphate synthase n=1 Tax=Roseiarcus fermentans TaxID=1473586 RepID=A0A366FR76_9HYPH|nr:CDP-alcohol phosphatidyltransferase family protein [Roseiarcus fermentans]RBP17162.1 phosphatidylglycerophosphate synthase [Roseiarcus fermentans]
MTFKRSYYDTRIHNSMLSGPERRLLNWTVENLPEWVTPNMMTSLGVFGGAVVFFACVSANYNLKFAYVAILGLLLNWFGDSLDGSLARMRGLARPAYGFYLDQFADVASHFLLLFGLGLSPFMHLSPALMALLGSMLLMFYDLLQLPFSRTHQLAYFGWGPTELRIVIAAGFVFESGMGIHSVTSPFGTLTLFDLVGMIVFVVAVASVARAFLIDSPRFAALERRKQVSRPARPDLVTLRAAGEPAPANRTTVGS